MSTKNSNMNEISKVSANSKKDFASLMKNTKAEIHKLGFVSNVISTNCSLSFFEAVAEGAGIKLSDRTKERLVAITKNKNTVKTAVVSYYPRVKYDSGEIVVVTTKTYEVVDTFNSNNNTKNPKVIENAVRLSDNLTILQKGYTNKAYNLFYLDYNNEKVALLKTSKSCTDGNIILTSKVFQRKERFSIDEAAVAVIAYAQSDVELVLE